ncbi:uncharacterized protein LOC124924882 [Impatiens glandulifera]|uniref:uncharacterized protein LOC124924882 n=1 Tax=Impatiens glandulifera TaxID=253017 RepID=UPI001FB09A75|nr:uncharacterized protein LOC124924882 [Impatiens glandulifera]
MKKSETIKEYFVRVTAVANQMRSNGETMSDTIIVEKILRTLTEKFIYVVVVIEEARDVKTMLVDELQSSLAVHEYKFKPIEKEEDQALRMSALFRGRGRGRGMNRGSDERAFDKSRIECFKCKKLGHFQIECPEWDKANYAAEDEKEEVLIMANVESEFTTAAPPKVQVELKSNEWFLDSICSNHMCGELHWFTHLDTKFNHSVKMGNDMKIDVLEK